MKRLVAMLTLCAGLALATGFTVQGNMSEAWDKSSLRVRAGEQGARLWLNLPARSHVTVVVKPDTGTAITTKLNMAAGVTLKSAGDYTVEVTRDSGAGQWTCRDVAGSPDLLGFTTTVDEKRHARVTYVTDEDKVVWSFTWPKDVTFLVDLLNPSGKVVEEQDLSDSNEFELIGGGSFTLEIVPTDGEGEFSTKKSQ